MLDAQLSDNSIGDRRCHPSSYRRARIGNARQTDRRCTPIRACASLYDLEWGNELDEATPLGHKAVEEVIVDWEGEK